MRMATKEPPTVTKNLRDRLLDFLEHGATLSALFGIGALVGAFVATPFFILCALALLFAFHRTVLKGQSAKLQVLVLIPMALVMAVAGYYLYDYLDAAVTRTQTAFAQQVARFVRENPSTQPNRAVVPNDEPPKTLEETFTRDFPYLMKSTFGGLTLTWRKTGFKLPIKRQVYEDFQAKTKFVGFYVPSAGFDNDTDYRACLELVTEVEPTMRWLESTRDMAGGTPGQMTDIKDLTFSGRVMLYTGDDLSIPQQAEIIKAFKAKNFDVNFEGPSHLTDLQAEWYREHPDTHR